MADHVSVRHGDQVKAVPILMALPEVLRGPAAEGSIRTLFGLSPDTSFTLEDADGNVLDVSQVSAGPIEGEARLVLAGESPKGEARLVSAGESPRLNSSGATDVAGDESAAEEGGGVAIVVLSQENSSASRRSNRTLARTFLGRTHWPFAPLSVSR